MASINPPPLFDVLTTTADDLRKRLEEGSINSVQIVESYLWQIEAHNTKGAKCRAVITTAPRFQLISRATVLDKERQAGKLRGSLHGIPILLKAGSSHLPRILQIRMHQRHRMLTLAHRTTSPLMLLWGCPRQLGPTPFGIRVRRGTGRLSTT